MKSIVIIGAGFSGAVIAARLLQRRDAGPLRVYLVNGDGRIARGMAYGTQSPVHTLNVPAGNMSAFDEDPCHFLRYAQGMDAAIGPGAFVSRRIYGDYLEWLLEQAELGRPAGTQLLRVYHHVVRIAPAANGRASLVALESGETIAADKVVLALGHFPAGNPRIGNMAFYDSARYVRDPWDQDRMDGIPGNAPVLLLGTGLTSVDVAMTLLDKNPERRILALSRHGLLPQAHRQAAGHPAAGLRADAIWGDADTVRDQLRGFRRYCRSLAAAGRDWREAMALLRPVTAEVWQAYPERERKRFLRHVQPYWDTHRHRLAPAVHERFSLALAAGTVQTLAARVQGFEEADGGVQVSLRARGAPAARSLRTGWVINCTGPCADPRSAGSPLVAQLLADGLMRTDSLGLGLEVDANCALINALGQASGRLFYIGPWLKANYWEATAVPDLRRFARQLAVGLTE